MSGDGIETQAQPLIEQNRAIGFFTRMFIGANTMLSQSKAARNLLNKLCFNVEKIATGEHIPFRYLDFNFRILRKSGPRYALYIEIFDRRKVIQRKIESVQSKYHDV